MSDVLSEAQKLYRESLDASREQRTQISEDMAFSDPSNPVQWDDYVRIQREGDPGGKRPCLVFDQTGQYVSNVAGQIEKQPPSIHAIPVGGGADKKAAEQIDGRFRHIEHASRASQHYARALTSAARAGVGYLTVRPVYVDRPLGWQEPRIGSEPDPLKVVFDPWSVETDGSDAGFGFILTSFSLAEAKRRWGKDALTDFGETEARRTDDTRKSVLIGEGWSKEDKTQEVIVYRNQDGSEETTDVSPDEFRLQLEMSQAPIEYVRTYKEKTTVVHWRRMSGADMLEESVYLANSIGIVPVYGYVSFVDGRMKYCGIPRRARGPQQAYNYHKSELLMPGAQLMASKRATKGVETLWDRSQTQRRAWLPYNDIDEEGAIQQPSLLKVGSNLVDHVGGAESSLRDIQASIGMYQANLGAPSNETSGVAIEGRKEQGEASTAHFPSHMAAALGQVGQIVMEMDANLSDTRRKQPIMGVDGSAGTITVDPEQKAAFARTPEGVTINPQVGSYGVRVVVGASYSTQRSQTNAAFGEIMRGNPALAPTVAPFWAQTLDFPGSDKFAQAMAAMAPPPVKAILQPEDGDQSQDPAELSHQLAECKKALAEAIQHAKDAQEDADQAIGAAADAKRVGEVKERELDIKAYEAETDRLKVTGANVDQIEAVTRGLIEQMLQQPDPLPGEEMQGDLPPNATAQEFDDELPPIDAPTPDAVAPDLEGSAPVQDEPSMAPAPPDEMAQ